VRRVVLAVLLLLALAACSGEDEEPTETDVAAPAFPLASGDIAEGEPIDPRYTCDGDDVSPGLTWDDVPEEAVELVLIVEDPDAPGGTFTHWLAYGIGPDENTLGEGTDGVGFRQGENDMGEVGYGGPCPPEGETHDYVFRLLAVDTETGLEEGARRGDVLEAVEGHVVGEARLTATYARSR
jgi:Raf kinase inhibitor-like YbhB/YbcL family protein